MAGCIANVHLNGRSQQKPQNNNNDGQSGAWSIAKNSSSSSLTFPHYITFYIVERKSSSSIFCQLNLSRVMMTRLMRCWCNQKKRKTSKQCTYSNDMTATVPVRWPPPTTTWASNQIYYETKPETHLNSETGWPSTTTQQQYSFGSYN